MAEAFAEMPAIRGLLELVGGTIPAIDLIHDRTIMMRAAGDKHTTETFFLRMQRA